jgi:hypothetical protein
MSRDLSVFGIVSGLVLAIAIIAFMFAIRPSFGAEQTRIYDANGRSIGTATPEGQGSVRYRDAGGRSVGTSTTTHGTTTFYGPSGNVTGRAVGPAKPR